MKSPLYDFSLTNRKLSGTINSRLKDKAVLDHGHNNIRQQLIFDDLYNARKQIKYLFSKRIYAICIVLEHDLLSIYKTCKHENAAT